ncbi:MAG: transglycosylase SLT domain-containing protein [Methylobacteriaceae bacterium]|nr:transglycosylase SLT domain-containing protein [Methylobacteriaceae bacterium]
MLGASSFGPHPPRIPALTRYRFGFAAALALCLAVGARAGEPPSPPPRPASFPELPRPPEVPAPTIGTSPVPEARKTFLPLIAAEAKAHGLPPEVADAVARIESGYNSSAIGGSGERGMMQVMPPTAALLGFKGTLAELADPATNIRLGVAYLADAWKLSGGDLCRTLMKYRAGHGQERMSALSVEYCRRAKSHLAAIGSPLAAGPLPEAEFGALPAGIGPTFGRIPGGAGLASIGPDGKPYGRVVRIAGRLTRIMPRRTAAVSSRFWASHMSRIKAIEAKLPWKKGGIIAGL